jgi:hypothetical protein
LSDAFPPRMSPETAAEFRRKRRGRNIALLLVLIAVVVLFYVLAIVKLGGQHVAGHG